MRPSNPNPDAGSAAVEFLVLGILMLVPVVYLVLTLSVLQGASFAAEGAARQAARSIALAADDASGRRAADDAVRVGLGDWRIPAGATAVDVRCAPRADDCAVARGTVVVRVRIAAALPLMPPVLHLDAPGSVPVEATAVQRVSMFTPTR